MSAFVQVIKKMGGADWPKLKVEFDRWRSSGRAILPPEVWDAADKYHGYQWWDSFGDDFEYLQHVATRILSKAMSASACEFNWSDVGNVINKKTQRLKDGNIEKIVNTRAMHRLEQTVDGKVLLGNIPKLDDFLDDLVNDAITRTTGAADDDVDDVTTLEDDSSGDEDYDVVADDEDPLYELGNCNRNAEEAIDQIIGNIGS